MTEPGAGSDLQGVRTTAVDKGDHYLLNGSKTFISNGINADLVIVVARTDPEAGHKGISLLVVERGMEGFERGRNLDKIGLHAQDTAELSFTDVVVPKENLLGKEGEGFIYLMQNLPQERLIIAAQAVAACEGILELCLDYAKTREAFGRPIGKFQHNRFLVAEMATETRIARVFLDDCLRKHLDQKLTAVDAAMAKWWTHRAAEQAGQPGGPAARRLRVHDGVPDRQGLPGQSDLHDLRRHDRDPEGDHRSVPGSVGLETEMTQTSTGPTSRTPASRSRACSPPTSRPRSPRRWPSTATPRRTPTRWASRTGGAR